MRKTVISRSLLVFWFLLVSLLLSLIAFLIKLVAGKFNIAFLIIGILLFFGGVARLFKPEWRMALIKKLGIFRAYKGPRTLEFIRKVGLVMLLASLVLICLSFIIQW